MGWQANLRLDYSCRGGRVVVHHTHDGPLRVLQSLYPEGEGICHTVLVHPPGGLVGGDTLDIAVHASTGSHALITTPGATRFYRSDGALARQRSHLVLDVDARLEWLPMEALCYNGCQAENQLTMQLAAGAELIGWDITALGLPLAGLPFVRGVFQQHLELSGAWLERARIDATDHRLLQSPVGLAGNHCIASCFLVTGSPLSRPRLEQALELAREHMAAHSSTPWAGVTSPNPRVVVLRVLTPLAEPATQLLRAVRSAWRQALWQLEDCNPRLWAM